MIPFLDQPMYKEYNRSAIGEVLELADRRDLGSRTVRCEGSSPSFPTNYTNINIEVIH